MKKLWPLWSHHVEIRDEVLEKTSRKVLDVVSITGDYSKNLMRCCTAVCERKLVQSPQIPCRIKKRRVCGQRFSCNWLYRITQYVLSCAIVPRVVAPFLWSRELSFLLTPTCGLSRSTHASDHFMNHSFLLSFWLLSSRFSSKLKWRHFRRIWPATELLQCNFVYCVLKCIRR